jgi:SAM-dependent methyltransferase
MNKWKSRFSKTRPSDKARTIDDFNEQWAIHSQLRESYWTSDLMFRDHFGDLFDPKELAGMNVLEVGSGSGRILKMILRYKPKTLIGVEPSKYALTLKKIYSGEDVSIVNSSGEDFVAPMQDYIISLGVLHHTLKPREILLNMHRHLRAGGKLIFWVYGSQDLGFLRFLLKVARIVTTRLNDSLLELVSWSISLSIPVYLRISILFGGKLPLTCYFEKVFMPCSHKERMYIVFDQLNPTIANYWSEVKIRNLLSGIEFQDVKLYNRHSYSWTVICIK